MAECRYCHEPAGLLRWAHKQCAAQHKTAIQLAIVKCSDFLNGGDTAENLRQSIVEIARDGYLENREMREIAIERISLKADALGNSGLISASDSDRIKQVASVFDVSLESCGSTKLVIDKSYIIRTLDEGSLPKITVVGNNAIHLQKGESVIWNFSAASLYEFKKHVKYVGGSRGISMRVARGIYYHIGTHRSRRVELEKLELVAKGEFAVCSKNVYFLSTQRTIRVALNKIVSVNLYSDGIEIFKDSVNGRPFIIRIADPHFATNILSRLT